MLIYHGFRFIHIAPFSDRLLLTLDLYVIYTHLV